MAKALAITMLCLAMIVVAAGCGNQEEPAATNPQSPSGETPSGRTPQEPNGTDANDANMPASVPAARIQRPDANARPQGQMAQVPPTMGAVPTKLGDPAYPLTGLTFVKGEPVQITPGKVYVVEFWATWCGPCLQSIPHLTELHEKYEDQGVVFVGVSNEDVPTVKPFVEKMGDKMAYNVAADTVGAVINGYMSAFKQGGIPTAFIVDQQGRVVWYGHPMADLDKVLGQVVAGTYEIPS